MYRVGRVALRAGAPLAGGCPGGIAGGVLKCPPTESGRDARRTSSVCFSHPVTPQSAAQNGGLAGIGLIGDGTTSAAAVLRLQDQRLGKVGYSPPRTQTITGRGQGASDAGLRSTGFPDARSVPVFHDLNDPALALARLERVVDVEVERLVPHDLGGDFLRADRLAVHLHTQHWPSDGAKVQPGAAAGRQSGRGDLHAVPGRAAW